MELIAIAFVIISFIGWIINQVNAQNRPPARGGARRPPQRGNRHIQNEIDDFLRESQGRGNQGQRVLSADEIEIVEERRPAPRRPVPNRQQRNKPGTSVSGRHLTGQDQLGSSVRDHVRTHMDQRVGAEENLPHAVDQLVSQHLGAFAADSIDSSGRTAQSETRRRAKVRAASLRAAFLTAGGARNAVLMQEILGRPRSLRGRKQ